MGRFWEVYLEIVSQLDNNWKVVELKVVRVRHSESKALWEDAIVRSGEIGFLQEGTPVGESRLRRRRSEFVRDTVIRVPLVSAIVHVA